MPPRRRSRSRLLPLAALAALGACTRNYPQTTLAPESEFGRMIDHVFMTTVWWGLGVFVVVEALLLYIVFRYRRRGQVQAEPEHVHGHTRLEIAWTIAPALILVFIAIPTVRTIFATQDFTPREGDLRVRVIGHQWWWEFQYPDLDVVTANELHLPAGRRAVFDLETADVLHSFWVPKLGGKRDVIPRHVNQIWLTPDDPGTYTGQCAELCGYSHARMGLRTIVDSPEDFQAWVEGQRRPAVAVAAAAPKPAAPPPAAAPTDTAGAGNADTAGGALREEASERAQADSVLARQSQPPEAPPAQPPATPAGGQPGVAPTDSLSWSGGVVGSAGRGAGLFQRSACVACHTIRGTPAKGKVGPDLTHVGGRERIAAELLENTPENMARWLANPPALKPGVLMPNLNLKPEQIADLVAYLESLK